MLIKLYGLLRQGKPVYPADVEQALSVLAREPEANLQRVYREEALAVSPKKTVVPKSATQRDYLAAIRKHDLAFGIGPAGTGKTYLAVAMLSDTFQRILTGIFHQRIEYPSAERDAERNGTKNGKHREEPCALEPPKGAAEHAA